MSEREPAGRRYVLISTDCHGGADLREYKPYLESRWHDEFDAWADGFFDLWGDIDPESDYKAGISSYLSPLNWVSAKRNEALEAEGIAAEVIFPNTVPPFFPVGALAAPGPRSQEEYDRRWAGIKAHNRWLKEFCEELPGRRFGVAQVLIDDVDDTVAEVRWAKEAGFRGILLPADHHLKLHHLYYRKYDPIWSVCAELDIPIGRHGAVVSSDEEVDSLAGAHACGVFETTYFSQRTLFQLIFSGVFDRHPDLKFTFTETGVGTWAVDQARILDGFRQAALAPGSIAGMFAKDAMVELKKLPSEYCRENVWVSAMFTGDDMPRRHEVGLDRLMWGADFPHHEGTAPYTHQVLRGLMNQVPEDEARELLAGTAAKLYGADLDSLQTVADRIGPTVEQLATPLTPDEIPEDPNFWYLGGGGPRVTQSSGT